MAVEKPQDGRYSGVIYYLAGVMFFRELLLFSAQRDIQKSVL